MGLGKWRASPSEWGLYSAPWTNPKGAAHASRSCSPSLLVGFSKSRVGSSPKPSPPPPPTHEDVEPATRRMRTDLPEELAASLYGPSALDIADGDFRNRYAVQPFSLSPTPPVRVSHPYDLGAAARNPMEGWPDYHVASPTGDPIRAPHLSVCPQIRF